MFYWLENFDRIAAKKSVSKQEIKNREQTNGAKCEERESLKLGRMKSVRASTKYASKHEGLCRRTADLHARRNFEGKKKEKKGETSRARAV